MLSELFGIVTVPVAVRFVQETGPEKAAPVRLALASIAACSPEVRAMVSELFGIVTVPVAVRFVQEIAPEKAAPVRAARAAMALACAVETGLLASEVLSTLPSPRQP